MAINNPFLPGNRCNNGGSSFDSFTEMLNSLIASGITSFSSGDTSIDFSEDISVASNERCKLTEIRTNAATKLATASMEDAYKRDRDAYKQQHFDRDAEVKDIVNLLRKNGKSASIFSVKRIIEQAELDNAGNPSAIDETVRKAIKKRYGVDI